MRRAVWCCLVFQIGLGLWPAAVTAVTAHVKGFVAVTNGTGSMQISSFDLDGSHERRLTAGPANHHYPSISADGRRLLFVGDDNDRDEIYSLDLAQPGARPVEVTGPPLMAESPSWSPDGREIAFSATLLGRTAYDIFVAAPDGSRPTQLTHGTDQGSSMPVFSPDGMHIAYINGRARADKIWVMNVDGSQAHPISDGPLDAYPAWLDDRTLMFAREDPVARRSSIMRVGLDGELETVSPSTVSLVEPRPVPDGTAYGATEITPGGLRLVMVSGGTVTLIATPAGDGEAYTMSWIVASPPAPGRAPAVPPLVLGLAGLAALAAAAVAARAAPLQQTSVC